MKHLRHSRRMVELVDLGGHVGLAVVRSLAAPRQLRTAQEAEDFEQELVDQYVLAMAASGVADAHVAGERAVVFEFIRFLADRSGRREQPMPTGSWTGCASTAGRRP